MSKRERRSQAKILEVGPYPPPRAGWALRIQFVREHIVDMGHTCSVLNIGANRKVPSDQYSTVRNGFDYLAKLIWYSLQGYTIHVHTNGDVWPTGWALAIMAEIIGLLTGKRTVLTFHAGTHQVYFPKERSGKFFYVLYFLFALPKKIICNNDAVKDKIKEYGITGDKIVPISAFSHQYVQLKDTSLPAHVEAFAERHDPLIFTYVFLRDGYYLDTMIDGLKILRQRWPKLGVINAGALDDNDESVRDKALKRLEEAGLTDHFCAAGDLAHDQFLATMNACNLYLRTPTTDGECASVLESLYLGVPVIAAENGNRPASVVTYPCDCAEEMSDKIDSVLSKWERSCQDIVKPQLHDTVQEEADLLIACALKTKITTTSTDELIEVS